MSEARPRTTDEQTRVTTNETESDQERTQNACPECGGALHTDEEHGETVCEECGLVVEENSIDHGPEWRAFNPQENASVPYSATVMAASRSPSSARRRAYRRQRCRDAG